LNKWQQNRTESVSAKTNRIRGFSEKKNGRVDTAKTMRAERFDCWPESGTFERKESLTSLQRNRRELGARMREEKLD
jgi:hypothetical protein